MFDLPTESVEDLRNYRFFRKYLMSHGFIMMQESIYTKLALNPTSADIAKKQVRKVVPKNGLIQMLTITEKQFQSMELLSGSNKSQYLDSDKRYIKL